MKINKDIFDYILNYINNNIQNVTAKDVSSKFNISRAYFSIIFKKFCGMNYRRYIQNKRLQKISEELLKYNKPLKQIITNGGYNSIPSFCRKFKKIYGVTPSIYKRKHIL